MAQLTIAHDQHPRYFFFMTWAENVIS